MRDSESVVFYALPIWFVSMGLMLALSLLDYGVMHLWGDETIYWLYKYWLSLTFLVVMMAFAVAYGIWLGNKTKKVLATMICSFLTVILVYISGALDNFYYLQAYLRGVPYSYEVWSPQWRWFGYWDFRLQVLWFISCTILIFLVWKVMYARFG